MFIMPFIWLKNNFPFILCKEFWTIYRFTGPLPPVPGEFSEDNKPALEELLNLLGLTCTVAGINKTVQQILDELKEFLQGKGGKELADIVEKILCLLLGVDVDLKPFLFDLGVVLGDDLDVLLDDLLPILSPKKKS